MSQITIRLFPLLTIALISLLPLSRSANFEIRNQCSYTVWAAAVPGGGQQLNPGQSWNLFVSPGTKMARVWARTGCNFDASGRGGCQTGDCGGVLACQAFGRPPNTLAEYALNQFNNLDFFDISLIDGFNVPMAFNPVSGSCRGITCNADIVGQCPNELRVPGGCNNACTTFKQDQYCCTGSAANNCGPTNYSRFFKDRCPTSYSYRKDDATSTFTCSSTDYRVIFCP
ncbi:Osmotin-like protein [Nymphaea thermarum]|nr:Osmotin-like protein [Nymphaea thermarum]